MRLLDAIPLRIYKSNAFQAFLYHVYYRFRCPGGTTSARECVRKGKCGCNNSSITAAKG